MASNQPHSSAGAEMVEITIDGQTMSVAKGTNLLEACLQRGIDVSYFCYHPGLSSPAVCRQCLVEVAGQPKLVPSCFTPVADKMQVITSSERVRKAREQMLEFTLVNHPIDCPVCDKAGECTLQKLYMDWDGRGSRTDHEKVHKPKVVDLGPHVMLDAERCILCSRCIRVCDEVAGQHQLEMMNRGDHEILSVAAGERLDNPYSLNTVDVCPVGALTSKDFRFQMRAWELYTTPSICPGCSTGCNIEVHHHQGEVWRLVPRENQAVNQFWMCDEGRFTYKEIRRQRLGGVRVGVGRGMPAQRMDADRAAKRVAETLQAVMDEGRVLGIGFGSQVHNEALYGLAELVQVLRAQGVEVRTYVLGRASRPDRVDGILRRADMNPNTAGAQFWAGAEAGDWKALRQDAESGQLGALWLVGEDLPGTQEEIRRFLQDLTDVFLVVQAVHDTDVVRRAQVMLPAALWAETDGTFCNETGQVQRTYSALQPAGDARTHWDWVTKIVSAGGWMEKAPWQSNAHKAFGALVAAAQQAEGGARIQWGEAVWGPEVRPVQLRFAASRG